MLGTMTFQSKENAVFDVKMALKKGHFRSFAEKGRCPDPQDSLVFLYSYKNITIL